MSKITVKFNEEKHEVKKPSEMPKRRPFVAKKVGTDYKVVMITFANNTVAFFEPIHTDKIDWDDTSNFLWVDANYEAIPNEKATVILEV